MTKRLAASAHAKQDKSGVKMGRVRGGKNTSGAYSATDLDRIVGDIRERVELDCSATYKSTWKYSRNGQEL